MTLGSVYLLGYPVDWWLVLGFGAQGLFFMRFIVQWIATERARRTMIPVAFWYFSMGGGFLIFVYSIHRQDPVFILGSFLSMIIYSRNLYFARMRPALKGENSAAEVPPGNSS